MGIWTLQVIYEEHIFKNDVITPALHSSVNALETKKRKRFNLEKEKVIDIITVYDLLGGVFGCRS